MNAAQQLVDKFRSIQDHYFVAKRPRLLKYVVGALGHTRITHRVEYVDNSRYPAHVLRQLRQERGVSYWRPPVEAKKATRKRVVKKAV